MIRKILKIAVPFLLFSHAAHAEPLSAIIMLEHIAEAVPNLMRLVTAIAYVMGMAMVMKGIMELKFAGEARSMYSREHSIKGPIIFLVVGAMLLYLPSAVQMGLSTFWTDPCPYCYLDVDEGNPPILGLFISIIQLIGVISFVRGLLSLSHLAHGHGQQNEFSRGITRMIGGIFCINIYEFVHVVLATLGIDL